MSNSRTAFTGHRFTAARWLAVLCIGAAAAAGWTAAWSQEAALKIGYVDMDKVMKDSAPGRAAAAKLRAEFTKREKELNDLTDRLKAAEEKLDKEAPRLAQAERDRRKRQLEEQKRELSLKRREFQEDLNLRRADAMAAVTATADKVITQIFEREKFDIILRDAIKAGSRVDITERVLQALNAGQGGK